MGRAPKIQTRIVHEYATNHSVARMITEFIGFMRKDSMYPTRHLPNANLIENPGNITKIGFTCIAVYCNYINLMCLYFGKVAGLGHRL